MANVVFEKMKIKPMQLFYSKTRIHHFGCRNEVIDWNR